MGRFFIRLVMTGTRKFPGTPNELFLIVIVETEQPGPAIDGLLPDDVVEMVVKPAFSAGLLPFSAGVYICQRNSKECPIRQSGDACFTGSLFHLPLLDQE